MAFERQMIKWEREGTWELYFLKTPLAEQGLLRQQRAIGEVELWHSAGEDPLAPFF